MCVSFCFFFFFFWLNGFFSLVEVVFMSLWRDENLFGVHVFDLLVFSDYGLSEMLFFFFFGLGKKGRVVVTVEWDFIFVLF